jgi:RNase adapter protein RapZ
VLAVTHLAQVAACADHHFVVSKALQGKATVSDVQPVAGEARVAEIARMLGGERCLSRTSRGACEAMLERELLVGLPQADCLCPAPPPSRPSPWGLRRRDSPLSPDSADLQRASEWIPLDASARDEVILITGISGSGKSVALHALEDAGYFCVDNLPPELLRDFIRLEHQRFTHRVAVAVDVRTAGSLPHLLPLIDDLRGEGVRIRSLFLDASTDALVRRFSETRRPHPLSAVPAGTDARARWSRPSSSNASCWPTCARSPPSSTPASCARRCCAAGCARWWARASGADAGLRVLRLQARRAAGRRLRVRRARAAQPVLHARAAPADRPRRAGGQLPGAQPEVMRDAVADRDLPARWLPAFEDDQRSYLTVAWAAPAASTARSTWSRCWRAASRAASHTGAPPRARCPH